MRREFVGVAHLDVLELDERLGATVSRTIAATRRRIALAALDRVGGRAQRADEHGRRRAFARA